MPLRSSSTRLPSSRHRPRFTGRRRASLAQAACRQKQACFSRLLRSRRRSIFGFVGGITKLTSQRGAFRVLQREPELLGQRLHRRAAALPLPFGLESKIADAASPRRDHATDGAEVAALGVFLIQTAHHLWRNPDKRAQRGGALDAVFPSVPRAAKHLGNLLEVVHEELLHVVVKGIAVLGAKRVGGKQLLQL